MMLNLGQFVEEIYGIVLTSMTSMPVIVTNIVSFPFRIFVLLRKYAYISLPDAPRSGVPDKSMIFMSLSLLEP